MRIPDSCIARERGYVVVDDEVRRAYRCIPNDRYGFWPKVNLTAVDGELFSNPDLKTVEVGYIDHVIYWPEMSTADRKKAVLFLCDVCTYLCAHNLHMESHLWNVVLQHGKPFLIDIGDFFEGVNLSSIKATILGTIYGKRDLEQTTHAPVTPESWISNYSLILKKLEEMESITEPTTYLQQLKKCLEDISPTLEAQVWDSYPTQKNSPKDKASLEAYAANQRPALCKVIKEKSPTTLVDIGCSYGMYSFFAALQGATTVGFDYSQGMISAANQKSQDMGLNCNFAYVDLLNISAWGVNGCYNNCLERFKSDAVIAPAVIHHVHGKNKTLQQIITEWASMARQWIMLEYIPFDTSNRPISSELIVNTLSTLGFSSIKFMDSSPLPRQWILAEK